MNSFSKKEIREQILLLQNARIEFQRICEPILLSGMAISLESVQAFLKLTEAIKQCEVSFSISADVIVDD